ncbi:methyltransferase domain-containing protein [Patescibacteria group bacterium]|nr:methyltransferase domain-containing protein [Patescibacteria group bacterium]
MEMNQFFETTILGRIFFPFHQKVSKVICRECEDFIEKGSKILDLGCGRGVLTNAIKNYFQAKVVGVDIKDQRIVKNFPFRIYNGEKLPFPDNSFDIVFLSYVLHHTEDPKKVISEAKRVTKKKIIIFEDLPEGIFGILMSKFHHTAYSVIFNHKAFHRKTRKGWEKSFNELDLRVVSSKRIKKWIVWLFPLPQKRIMFVLEKKRVPAHHR